MTPASCHPSKPALTQNGPHAGLCAACYHRARRDALKPPPPEPDPAALAPLIVDGQLDLARAITLTDAELIAALPEAARALRRTLATDPTKGYALKAAEALLRGFPVASPSGQRRLLESAPKAVEGGSATQVVIGLHVTAGAVQVGRVVGTVGPPIVQKKSPGE